MCEQHTNPAKYVQEHEKAAPAGPKVRKEIP